MKFLVVRYIAIIFFLSANFCSAAAVFNYGEHFLESPVEELIKLKSPKVISFGCGHTASIEINKLNSIFGSDYTYVCIEKDKEKMSSYKGSALAIHAADGADLEGLLRLGLKLNDFDLALVRHPDFHSYAKDFRTIFRKVLPKLLKRDGIVVVTLVSELEEQYVARNNQEEAHENQDTLLFDIQYKLIKQISLPHIDKDLSHQGCGRDKLQYYFKNSCNRAAEKLSSFVIFANLEANPFLPQLVDILDGKVIEVSKDTLSVRLNSTHMQSLTRIYGLRAQQIERSYCQNPQCGSYENEEKRLSNCGGCLRSAYCSQNCQKAHWPTHKYFCKKQ
jgi:hypothetical protein